MKSDLVWRIERVCREAWPAIDEIECGDWLLRYSGGDSRRANSANPLREPARDIDAGLAACEEFYRQRGRPAFFRVPSFIGADIDTKLHSRGYSGEGETCTLYGDIGEVLGKKDAEVEISEFPSVEWLAAMNRLQVHSDAQRLAVTGIVSCIGSPVAFAGLRSEGNLASLAIGVIRDHLLCFEAVVTDARCRGRGFARRVLAHLVAWAASQEINGACLQVVATNEPALKLYHGLGLQTEVYRYHYRREPA